MNNPEDEDDPPLPPQGNSGTITPPLPPSLQNRASKPYGQYPPSQAYTNSPIMPVRPIQQLPQSTPTSQFYRTPSAQIQSAAGYSGNNSAPVIARTQHLTPSQSQHLQQRLMQQYPQNSSRGASPGVHPVNAAQPARVVSTPGQQAPSSSQGVYPQGRRTVPYPEMTYEEKQKVLQQKSELARNPQFMRYVKPLTVGQQQQAITLIAEAVVDRKRTHTLYYDMVERFGTDFATTMYTALRNPQNARANQRAPAPTPNRAIPSRNTSPNLHDLRHGSAMKSGRVTPADIRSANYAEQNRLQSLKRKSELAQNTTNAKRPGLDVNEMDADDVRDVTQYGGVDLNAESELLAADEDDSLSDIDSFAEEEWYLSIDVLNARMQRIAGKSVNIGIDALRLMGFALIHRLRNILQKSSHASKARLEIAIEMQRDEAKSEIETYNSRPWRLGAIKAIKMTSQPARQLTILGLYEKQKLQRLLDETDKMCEEMEKKTIEGAEETEDEKMIVEDDGEEKESAKKVKPVKKAIESSDTAPANIKDDSMVIENQKHRAINTAAMTATGIAVPSWMSGAAGESARLDLQRKMKEKEVQREEKGQNDEPGWETGGAGIITTELPSQRATGSTATGGVAASAANMGKPSRIRALQNRSITVRDLMLVLQREALEGGRWESTLGPAARTTMSAPFTLRGWLHI